MQSEIGHKATDNEQDPLADDPPDQAAGVPLKDGFDPYTGLAPIVGLSGSVGSFEALQNFFSTLPSDNGMAYVVVHLPPE